MISIVKRTYGEIILEDTLKLMEALENNTPIEEVKNMLDKQGHSRHFFLEIRNLIYSFSSRGPEFWESTADQYLTQEAIKLVEAKKRENFELAQNNKKENTQRM